ncbi:MAG: ATP-binding protein [Thermodesulfobacteriota bacterium]
MRIVQLKVSNFRCFKDETVVSLDNLVLFIGKNDSGKSSLLDAMDIFFNEVPEQDDVCVHGSDKKVSITCVFDELPTELVIDEQHPTNLSAEYLLNRDGRLEVVKVFNCSGSGKVRAASVFARAKHPTADKFNDLLTLTNAKLKQRAKELGVDVTNVNQTINTELRRAIWAQAPDLQCKEIDIELKSETAEKIWEQLKKHLPVFALFKSDRPSTDQDAEAQDPMKSAIKEAIKGQEILLNDLAEKVKKEVQEIANRTVEKIREMAPDLANQLTPRVTNKNWESLFSVSLTGDEDIPINKRGSGTRRLVLLNFFRAKAERDAEGKGAGIIYAIEEPETSQHPNNQKMIIEAFDDLASRTGCQVFLTTHTPTLARKFSQTALRYVTWKDGQPIVYEGRNDETLAEIANSLGVLPDHNIRTFFGVEGRNDITFLTTVSKILHDMGEDVPNLGEVEDNGHLVFVPLGGSSLDLWVSRLRGFNRPEFYLMDRDTCPPEKPRYYNIAEELGKRTNCTVWTTGRKELENYIHPDLIKASYPGYSGVGNEFEDVPMLLAQAVHEASGSGQTWADILSDPEKLSKKISNAKRRLCTEFVSKMTSDLLAKIDLNKEVIAWLKAIGVALQAA